MPPSSLSLLLGSVADEHSAGRSPSGCCFRAHQPHYALFDLWRVVGNAWGQCLAPSAASRRAAHTKPLGSARQAGAQRRGEQRTAMRGHIEPHSQNSEASVCVKSLPTRTRS